MADNESPFAKFEAKAWPFWYEGELVADRICGGVPSNEKTAEAWIRAKLKDTRSESEVKALVRKTTEEIRDTHKAASRKPASELLEDELAESEPTAPPSDEDLTEQAINQVASDMAGFNMFKRAGSGPEYKGLTEGVLYIEGRQLKAALKEAVAVAANAGKIRTKNWGDPDNAAYKKQLKGWFPEHVFVTDTLLPLRTVDGDEVTEPNGVLQKFVHTHRGDAIGYEEYVDQAVVRFHVKTDVELSEEEWAMIWLTGQDQGLGASRSQGFGVYTVRAWRPVPLRERTTR
jgi:hypothetical protein